jgi:hypothetical protein
MAAELLEKEKKRRALLEEMESLAPRIQELRNRRDSFLKTVSSQYPPTGEDLEVIDSIQEELIPLEDRWKVLNDQIRAIEAEIRREGGTPLPESELKKLDAAVPTVDVKEEVSKATEEALSRLQEQKPAEAAPSVTPITVNVTTPPPEYPKDLVEAMRQSQELECKKGDVGPLKMDSALGNALAGPIRDFLKAIGLDLESLSALKGSPADPKKAAELAQSIAVASIGAHALLATVGIVSEMVSLGQIETVMSGLNMVLQNTGIAGTLASCFSAPFYEGLIKPAQMYWRSVFTTEVPGPSDLIRFVVREVIKPEDFDRWMRLQGFSSEWSKAYWEAHWVLPSRGEVIEAYHRGIISKEEMERYLVWHDYKPEPRPGISKSDMEIVAGLTKTLMGRVDVRRAYELGFLEREQLVEWYRKLGYEEDAELMAEVQAEAALEAERTAVARAAGRLFRDGRLTEEKYRGLLGNLRILGDRQDLWVLRYRLERASKPSKEEEAAEEHLAGAPSEETTE